MDVSTGGASVFLGLNCESLNAFTLIKHGSYPLIFYPPLPRMRLEILKFSVDVRESTPMGFNH